MKFGMGQPAPRREDPRFLTGAGLYVDDIQLENQAFGYVLRSPVAHGKITRVGVQQARAMPGVHLVWAAADVQDRLCPMVNEIPVEPAPAPVEMPHLATERVRFAGEPVVFVVGDSLNAARDAAEQVVLDIEELDPVLDPEAALEDGVPRLHDTAPGNLSYTWTFGDADGVEKVFAEAERVISTRVVNQRLVVASMEPRAIQVRYLADEERWEAWVGTQGAHRMQGVLARALGVKPDRVRVHVPDVGGAFGMKLMAHPEYGLAALAAKEIGRPVKWVGDRSESFLSDAQARDMRGTVEGAFDADGRCRAMRMKTVSGLGAYHSSYGAAIHTIFSAPLLGGMYAIEEACAEVRGAFTNTTPTDAYRGAGRPETIYATERLMDAAARALGIDPVEIRRRNLLTRDDAPHTTPGGLVFDSMDPARVLDRAIETSDLESFETRCSDSRREGRARGIGLAYYFERTGGQPQENARAELGQDGILRIRVGTQSTGQGHETVWAQFAAEHLGLDPDRVVVEAGDSDALPMGGGTGGSRSLIMAGGALQNTFAALIEKGLERAAGHLEAAPADIEFKASESRFTIAGTDRSVGLVELAAATGALDAYEKVKGGTPSFPNGAHVCEVEIDRETGWLDVVRYTVIDDFGTVVNPMLAAGQVHGGVAQGIGQVMGEQALWDENGQPVSASFMDYRIPKADEIPNIDVSFEQGQPCRTNPLGVKGCGEAGSVGGISATALAVLDALHRAGAEPIETPYTPEKLWRALNS